MSKKTNIFVLLPLLFLFFSFSTRYILAQTAQYDNDGRLIMYANDRETCNYSRGCACIQSNGASFPIGNGVLCRPTMAPAPAQPPDSTLPAGDPDEITAESIDKMLDGIISKLTPIAGLLAFAFVVYGAYMWMMSAGDPEKIKRSQGIIQWAVLGLIFVIITSLVIRAILTAIQ